MAITREDLNEIIRNEVASEFSHVPANEKEISIHFSKKFTDRMDKLLLSQKKSYWKYVNTFSKRVAIACVTVLLLFTTACSFEEIREPIVNFIKEVHQSFIQYFFEGDTVKDISYEFQIHELPEGFEKTEVNRSSGRTMTTYENDKDEMIIFTQLATETLTHFFDQEQGEISTEKIGNKVIELYVHAEFVTAVWTEDSYFFELTYYGNISGEKLKNLISSIK